MTTRDAGRERPILFSGPMVRALLDGRKTQTRRVVKLRNAAIAGEPKHDGTFEWWPIDRHGVRSDWSREVLLGMCPYGRAPREEFPETEYDRLYVRETWNAEFLWPEGVGDPRFRWWHQMPPGFRGGANALRAYYDADSSRCMVDGGEALPASTERSPRRPDKWVPSIHMPRWASRLTLEITEVRVERVNEISEADAEAEGVAAYADAHLAKGNPYDLTRVEQFELLWDSLNKERGYPFASSPWVWVIGFKRVGGASLTETPAEPNNRQPD